MITANFTLEQQFWLAIAGQIVIVIGMILTYLKTRDSVKKTEEQGVRLEKVAIQVDGRLTQLLAAKDAASVADSRVAHIEGRLEGLPVPPVTVVVPTPTTAVSGGQRKDDPPNVT